MHAKLPGIYEGRRSPLSMVHERIFNDNKFRVTVTLVNTNKSGEVQGKTREKKSNVNERRQRGEKKANKQARGRPHPGRVLLSSPLNWCSLKPKPNLTAF